MNMDDTNTLEAISNLVAEAMNREDLSDIEPALAQVMPENWSTEQKVKALSDACVYALVAEQPGYPHTGEPVYLAAGTDLKAAILHEIDAMLAADFDRDEHSNVWRQIQSTIAATPDADFQAGVAVNCPDDYLLTLDKLSCTEVLSQKNALPAWAKA